MQTAARQFREIPVNVITSKAFVEAVRKLRVAAYARVSTDNEEQATSYEAQVEYYDEKIKNNPLWEHAGLYADEGITGTSMKRRKEFKRMIADAMAGKIDMIMTKSISRFARNTVDCLKTVRDLKEIGVKVYFEKENIDSMDPTGTLMLSILSSIAEEESRNISTNGKWRIQRMFEKGEVLAGRGIYGYTIVDKNKYEINIEQAAIVRRVFAEFIGGKSIGKICEGLTRDGIPTPNGKGTWTHSTVLFMLKNEKYIGDAQLQKTYKLDVLSTTKKNKGEVKSYYVSNNHMGIVDRETFAAVQEDFAKRSNGKDGKVGFGKYSSTYAFSRKMRCEECGSLFRRGQQRSRAKDGKVKYIWTCINHLDIRECKAPPMQEREVEDAFMMILYDVIDNQEQMLDEIRHAAEEATAIAGDYDADAIIAALNEKQAQVLELSRKRGNAAEEHRPMITALMNEIDNLNEQLAMCETAQTNMLSVKQRLRDIEATIANSGLSEFNAEIFKNLVDEIQVGKLALTFRFRCGINLSHSI